MIESRPSPDELLRRITTEERLRTRGRLKVFFGACPGVGKTYAMLVDARDRARDGVDVVVGVVETHNRTETEALLDGREILPRREIDYRGIKLQEFDIDGALRRRPQLLLLDELAHTNAPGSRHARRWQDARELLAAGIDVYTTLNVQHIESLNDVVAQITGIRQRETVPDSVLEEADEIVLVDLSPEELQKRLAEGKVYLPDQARRAIDQYFKKQNLVALRELALRFMADRVNVQVQFARRDATVDQIWPTTERLLVCVGPSPTSARLIRSTRRLAAVLQAEWIALTVETPGITQLSEDGRHRIAEHQRLAQRLGAEIVTVSGQNMPEEVIRYARLRNITKIIVGKPVLPWWRERLMPTLVDRIVRLSGDIDIYVIRGEGELSRNRFSLPKPVAASGVYYRRAFLIVLLCTLLNWLLFTHLSLSDLIMVYLVGIMWAALPGRSGPALAASALSVLLFDVLFVPPRFTVAVSDVSHAFTFAVMLGAGGTISALTARVRRQAEVARVAALRMAAQYRLSQFLIEARDRDALLQAGANIVAETSECSALLLSLSGNDGQLRVVATHPAGLRLDDKDLSVAQWVCAHGEAAGCGTNTLASAEMLHLPLLSRGETLGVMSIRPANPVLDPDTIRLFEAYAGQIALALDVARLRDQQQQAQLQIEAERLQSSILSSVSHDLRTPLATIIGSADSLLESGRSIDEATRRELLVDILQEAERLSRLIANLLEMIRLEGGAMELRREPQHLEEIVGTALRTLARKIEGRRLTIEIPPDLPLVDVDGILIQHVFMNLIDNAVNYSEAGRPLQLKVRAWDAQLVVQVLDEGPGIKAEERKRVFDKFYRGTNSKTTQGSGLGLAISKAIIAAHGGTIDVTNRPGGGSIFTFTLPASSIQLPEEQG